MNNVNEEVTVLTDTQIAEVVHEANRVYCVAIGDNSVKPWTEAPDILKNSVIAGVKIVREQAEADPDNWHLEPGESHESWLSHKLRECWTYGPVKDVEKKQHPCMLPYNELPEDQKRKDALFLGIVRALLESQVPTPQD